MASDNPSHHFARVNGIRMHYVTAGEGPPLFLIHGYPQSWFMWKRMIALLAPHFSLVIPDLRGYGDTDKPRDGYDKRTMAADLRELARHLGHERIGMAGHDRGARVTHRYALDHGESLAAVSVLDIVPTLTTFEATDQALATGMWHWFFFLVPDLPEAMIASNLDATMRYFCRTWAGDPAAIGEEAIQEYIRTFRIPGTIRASLEDYRAGAGIDLEHAHADGDHVVEAPLQALWGGLSPVARKFDVLEVWRRHARQAEGKPIAESGHFIPEEAPAALVAEMIPFFQKHLGG